MATHGLSAASDACTVIKPSSIKPAVPPMEAAAPIILAGMGQFRPVPAQEAPKFPEEKSPEGATCGRGPSWESLRAARADPSLTPPCRLGSVRESQKRCKCNAGLSAVPSGLGCSVNSWRSTK